MLENTFIHIQGIGLKTERRFWQGGVLSWDDFTEPYPMSYSVGKGGLIIEKIEEARLHLTARPQYFCDLLPSSQHWRIFPHFRSVTCYLDIETTGLGEYARITTVALYDGEQIRYYVQGENLDDFPGDLEKYDVLVTYNGRCFDVPVIEHYFGIKLRQAHIDLRYVLHSLGLKGGLKGCERSLGLDRGELAGVDGFFAVLLWNEYQRSGNRRALETLLAYNIEDTVNLERLMVEAYNRSLAGTPFVESHRLASPEVPLGPFRADVELIEKIRALMSAGPWY